LNIVFKLSIPLRVFHTSENRTDLSRSSNFKR